MPRKKRKYQIIWERIKETKHCKVTVYPAMVARVKKAVAKEKHKDLGFKVLNDHDRFRVTVEVKDSEKDKGKKEITFTLKAALGLEEMKV